ncbi:MAG: hypothetical protein LBQ31_07770 [Bacteroidales bacterium]|nr:hypothetical protein [Bacteroidales bacterium]
MAFPRPLAELRGRGRAFACIFFVHPAKPCATKKDVGSIPNASPRTAPAHPILAPPPAIHAHQYRPRPPLALPPSPALRSTPAHQHHPRPPALAPPPAPALVQLRVSLTLYVCTSSGFVEN